LTISYLTEVALPPRAWNRQFEGTALQRLKDAPQGSCQPAPVERRRSSRYVPVPSGDRRCSPRTGRWSGV